ncbi:ChaC-like protein-domain-containing protein [Pyronema omphalodes]|nr:ChaC-like protein-domain-containing protein [Pyronema omphalodes]
MKPGEAFFSALHCKVGSSPHLTAHRRSRSYRRQRRQRRSTHNIVHLPPTHSQNFTPYKDENRETNISNTSHSPGRVVTLITRQFWETLGDHHEADEKVWGTLYRIPRDKVESVKEYLDIREINGYSIHYVDVYQEEPLLPPIKALVYIGTPTNPQFVPLTSGVPSEESLASHIYASRGPSGENREYLYKLHMALEELCPESSDNHVRSLFRKVAIMEAEERLMGIADDEDEGMEEMERIEGGPQEEVEPEMLGDTVMQM